VVDICLLGCGGMMPLPDRFLTALLLRYNGKMTLTDCGEGTQIPIKLAGWGFKSIDAICFTHYHADHIAGLPGLLLTLGNSGRTEPLSLFGPTGLTEVVKGLTVISPFLPFPLILNELPLDRTSCFKAGGVKVMSFPADHGIACLSYTFNIERQRSFIKENAEAAKIPLKLWHRLQNCETVCCGDAVFTPDMVLGAPRKGIKVGYCTDTRPSKSLSDFMALCDLLVGEGIYGDNTLLPKANGKGHMVFSQAAQTAKESESKELWLTHFSPALTAPEESLCEASKIFDNVTIGKDLMMKTIFFED
jgi:ribonuclease Z